MPESQALLENGEEVDSKIKSDDVPSSKQDSESNEASMTYTDEASGEEETSEEDSMVLTLAGLIGIDLDKQPTDVALNEHFHTIMKSGAERLAQNFSQHGTSSEDGGYWCGKEALAEIGKTCDLVKEQLWRILDFGTLLRSEDRVVQAEDEDAVMVG